MVDDDSNPEALARRTIDAKLVDAGWVIQDRDELNLAAGRGVAVREFLTDVGPCDYLLFINKRPAGVIEAKRDGVVLTGIEAQTRDYADKLPGWASPPLRPLPFLYETTGVETRFTNLLDPTPRSHRIFQFHQPPTLQRWFEDALAIKVGRPGAPVAATFRGRMKRAPPLNDVAGRDPRCREPRAVDPRGPSEGTHPDGHRVGEDVHHGVGVLPSDQVRRCPPGLVPGGPREPGEAGPQGVPASLAVFKPTRILDFIVEADERDWKPERVQAMRDRDKQPDLFTDEEWRETFRLVNKLPYAFSYRFEDDSGRQSTLQILDWEIGALYWNCLRGADGDETEAIAKVRVKYMDYFLRTDLHFFVGTTQQWHFVATRG